MSSAPIFVNEEDRFFSALALVLGRSLDLAENLGPFLELLTGHEHVEYAGLWLCERGGARLAGDFPPRRGANRVFADHPMLLATPIGPRVHRSDEPVVAGVVAEGAEYGWFFRAGEQAVLAIGSRRPRPFTTSELTAMAELCSRLAVTVAAALGEEALTKEREARRRAEEALRTHEARALEFTETAADWYWETDADLCITFVSGNHDRLTGLAAPSVLGATPATAWFGREPDDAAGRALVADLDARAHFERREVRWQGPDGRERVHRFSARPLFGADENFLGYRGIAADVTEQFAARGEQARLEAQLMQAQKMEAIGQLTGGIAHDFNNILASVLGFAELARDALPESEERLDRYLEEIQSAGERARDLVTKMLTYSRGGTGTIENVRVAPVVREAIALLRSTMPSTLQVHLDARAPDAVIRSDGVSLQQVLMNLCINARDAMRAHKGDIHVTLDTVTGAAGHCESCHGSINGERVVLAVSDSGEGIDDAVRERMFEPFFSTKPSGEGTGMGLPMVHGIVHRHGGHLEVQSAPGEGVRIAVHWPAMDPSLASVNAPQERARPVSGSGERILVVDDEMSVAVFLGELLSRRGYRVEVTTRPEEARQMACETPARFDLILTDQTMPALTGRELIAAVRAVHPALPVILCTGYSESVSADHGLGERAAFVRKPIKGEELVRLVQRLLVPAKAGPPASEP